MGCELPTGEADDFLGAAFTTGLAAIDFLWLDAAVSTWDVAGVRGAGGDGSTLASELELDSSLLVLPESESDELLEMLRLRRAIESCFKETFEGNTCGGTAGFVAVAASLGPDERMLADCRMRAADGSTLTVTPMTSWTINLQTIRSPSRRMHAGAAAGSGTPWMVRSHTECAGCASKRSTSKATHPTDRSSCSETAQRSASTGAGTLRTSRKQTRGMSKVKQLAILAITQLG